MLHVMGRRGKSDLLEVKFYDTVERQVQFDLILSQSVFIQSREKIV